MIPYLRMKIYNASNTLFTIFMYKNVHVIINPAAGQEEPILSYLNKTFLDNNINWDVSVSHKQGDVITFIRRALRHKPDLIVVYGGDGTVMEAAIALFQKNVPLAILPGGTANVMAKGLGIAADTRKALQQLFEGKSRIRDIDMGLCNGRPFLIRITVGAFAHMVKDASRELKNNYGALAYGVTALKHIGKQDSKTFHMKINGKQVSEDGSTLLITNSGNVGLPGVSILPTVSVTDGLLDVILLKDTNLSTLASMTGNMLLNNKQTGLVKHWKVKDITVRLPAVQTVILDDAPQRMHTIKVKVISKAIKILVPSSTRV